MPHLRRGRTPCRSMSFNRIGDGTLMQAASSVTSTRRLAGCKSRWTRPARCSRPHSLPSARANSRRNAGVRSEAYCGSRATLSKGIAFSIAELARKLSRASGPRDWQPRATQVIVSMLAAATACTAWASRAAGVPRSVFRKISHVCDVLKCLRKMTPEGSSTRYTDRCGPDLTVVTPSGTPLAFRSTVPLEASADACGDAEHNVRKPASYSSRTTRSSPCQVTSPGVRGLRVIAPSAIASRV